MRTFQSRNAWFLKFMWKTLVQGHVDYCSQLYFPAKSSDMEKIENLQRNFTNKIPEVRHLENWAKLKQLKLLSQERRMDRYRITHSNRREREVKIPPVKGIWGKIQPQGGQLPNPWTKII